MLHVPWRTAEDEDSEEEGLQVTALSPLKSSAEIQAFMFYQPHIWGLYFNNNRVYKNEVQGGLGNVGL